MISGKNSFPQKEQPSQKAQNDPMALLLFISSNTVMAVVPDSNRIPFYIYSANNFSNRIFIHI